MKYLVAIPLVALTACVGLTAKDDKVAAECLAYKTTKAVVCAKPNLSVDMQTYCATNVLCQPGVAQNGPAKSASAAQ